MTTIDKKTVIDLTDLSRQFNRFKACKELKQTDNMQDAKEQINAMLQLLPSGSGLDSGVQFNWEESNPNRLVFDFSYQHLNSNGYYDSWTYHKLILTPSFVNAYDMRITGRDRNGVKEYLYELFGVVFYF